MSDELQLRVLELYREADQSVAEVGPVCLASGRCCRFKEYDHVLFLSNLEAEILLRGSPSTAADGIERCPYQLGNLCTAREARPLACRVYYCDPAYQDEARRITEHYLRQLKLLADEYNVEWCYAPLHKFLREQTLENRDGG